MKGTPRHLAAAGLFAALSLAWSYPLVAHIGTHLPGEGFGDNVSFLWNFWWMRHALSAAGEYGFPANFLTFFQTHYIFAPFGADLTLHTHTALPALLGATILRPLAPVVAQNVVILAALWLNGFAAYLLAFDRTRDFLAAILAGLVFAGSPYLSMHLLGHFNLIHAWGIPLFLLFLFRAIDLPAPEATSAWRQRRASLFASIVLVLIAYCDYYYLVYCLALTAGIVVWRAWPLTFATNRRSLPRPLLASLALLLLADAALIVTISVGGGFTFQIGNATVLANSVANPLTLAWILVGMAAWYRYRPIAHRLAADKGARGALRRALGPMMIVAAIGILPLAISGVRMWQRGDYVSAPPSWRSGPGGIDLATLVLGNPMHPLVGSWTTRVYGQLGIDRMEKSGWMGIIPVALAVWMIVVCVKDRRRGSQPSSVVLGSEARLWMAIGLASFLWALGPWLSVAGTNVGLPLPQILLARVPVIANARMPGRAMVVVMLAVALLSALALMQLELKQRRRLVLPLCGFVFLEFLPAPYPLAELGPAPSYATVLAGRDGGALCPLPFGWRDGSARAGHFDERVLIDQFTHGHPLVGGFIARLPQSTQAAYRAAPVLRTLLLLSEDQPADQADLAVAPAAISHALLERDIRFVMLDRRVASDSLVMFVHDRMLLRLMDADASGRELYEIIEAAAR